MSSATGIGCVQLKLIEGLRDGDSSSQKTGLDEKSKPGYQYTHGHHESVLRSHTWRTAANSAAYLLPYLRPDMKILDVGCGPGTITADLAALVPEGQVIGFEYAPEVLKQAQDLANERGLKNLQFAVGDVHALEYADGTFDVVHAHQVLQHLGDPIRALREMRRVTKPNGIVAVRDADFGTFAWYPEIDGMCEWSELYFRVARSNGGDPNAGRKLFAWARAAGFDSSHITSTAGTWCYYTPEERAWWSGLWADRTVGSAFATGALEKRVATNEELMKASQAWRNWGKEENGWFALMHGELICRV